MYTCMIFYERSREALEEEEKQKSQEQMGRSLCILHPGSRPAYLQ